MDYKEKYEEALERAKKLHDGFEGYDANRHIIEEIFPELAESEDERIRKEMISFIEAEACDSPISKGWISWLEKQKDEAQRQFNLGMQAGREEMMYELEKDASKAIEAVERIDKYIDEHVVNAHDMDDSNPGKNYYCGWDDALGKMAGILQDVYSEEKQQEQNPAEWSEEDETCIENALWCIERARQVAKDACDFDACKSAGKFIKSLRPQPKAELTLLDENIIKAAVAFVEQNDHFNCWRGIDKHTVIKALRSIKPHWKPSEAQMQWLESAVKLSTDKPEIHGIIISLYEQLKRL